MKPSRLSLFALVAALLPALAFAANDGKPRKKPAAGHGGGVAEVVKTYDKNGNHQIEPEELAAMQQVFAEFRKLDKNSNGEIEQGEVAPPKSASTDDRRARAMAGLKKVDKNGNGKVDADEVEPLQKMLAGGRIMQRLDQNGNGRLEPGELEQLNQRIAQGAGGKAAGPGAPPPASKPTGDADGAAKPEKKKDDEKKFDETKDPFAVPAPKPPGNFGT